MVKQKTPERILIRNTELWNPDKTTSGCTVFIESGKVVRISGNDFQVEGAMVIDGDQMILMPSGVDAHVHLRVPGQTHKETPETGLAAAARGGYGAVLNMPNTSPPIDSVEICEQTMQEMKPVMEQSGIEVFLSACITKTMKGEELTNIDALAEWGVKTFTDDGLGVERDDIMSQVFERAAKYQIPVSQHAEYKGHGGILSGGKTREDLNIPYYPPSAEFEMVTRDIDVLKKHPDARYHLLHVSLRKSVELIVQAREEGLNASAEVTPHHLYYSYNDIPSDNTSFKMNPPLRDDADRNYLRDALMDERISFVATDHAPHHADEKGVDFCSAAFGTTGMETSLLVLLDLYRKKELDAQRLVRVFSTAPAGYLNISDRFGAVNEGRHFNAILINRDFASRKISETDLSSKSKNNIFLGVDLPGKIEWFFNPVSTFNFT